MDIKVEELKSRLVVIETKMDMVERKVDGIDNKLDKAIEAHTGIQYVKWILGAAWGAIAALYMKHFV